MENQHQKIKGYRELGQEEIDLMNRIKAHAEETALLLHDVAALRDHMALGEDPCLTPEQWNESKRCLKEAKTHLQTGQMWFVRAVALPDSF